jgi:heme/copper-type cytochrome/quinol oxidase subunit 3
MNTARVEALRTEPSPVASAELIRNLPWDVKRGTEGTWWFIASEAMLFTGLFFSYFYLGHTVSRWPPDSPPKLMLALIMLGVLVASSLILEWGRRQGKRGRDRVARRALLGSIILGAVFIALQVLEYRNHLKELRPTADAYGSIFYTITTFHGAHLALGLLMLIYVLFLPELEPTSKPPHRPYHNAALYWHFVDVVWVFIVLILYVSPRL